MESLKTLLERVVAVMTLDGRLIVGTLKGFDHVQNLVLSDAVERVFSTEAGVELQTLGLYVVRGDSVGIIGEVDEAADAAVKWDAATGTPLKPIVHSMT